MKALAITATAVFWTFALGAAWLAYNPGSDKGEPMIMLQIEQPHKLAGPPSRDSDSSRQSASVPTLHQPAGITTDLPPGISVLQPVRTNTAE